MPAAANLSAVLRDAPPGLLLQGRLMLQTGLAEALYRIGDWDGAASQAELAISIAEDAGIQLGLGMTYGVASYVSAGRRLVGAGRIAGRHREQLRRDAALVGEPGLRGGGPRDPGARPAETTRLCREPCVSSTIPPYAS